MAETGGRTGERDFPGLHGPACPVAFCPVGLFLTVAGQVRPEMVDHLMAAGRELMLAAQVVLEARASASSEPPRLEKIEVE